ncbi:cyclase family protein [Neobacillus sp. NPDC093182]|uniref:cyclase family protein n=1 Tax=Neobacillus sp. NPDC093182 TaxID=3364297 RepID=UPI0037FDBAF0
MRIIDLTLTIDPETKYPGFPRSKVYGKPESVNQITKVASVEENKVSSHDVLLSTQHFTHYDAPSHYIIGGLNNDEVPLDWLVGEAVVFDMMHKKAGEIVTAADLEATGVQMKKGDIVIIRTGWTDKMFGTFEFWDQMIYLSTDAAEWLMERGIKSLVQDFMTCDSPLHPPAGREWGTPNWSPNHLTFLGNNVCLIEWCTNLGEIKEERVFLACAPIKLKGTEGAPCRVFAVEGLINNNY